MHLANKISVTVTEETNEPKINASNIKPVFVKLKNLSLAEIETIQKVIPICFLNDLLLTCVLSQSLDKPNVQFNSDSHG